MATRPVALLTAVFGGLLGVSVFAGHSGGAKGAYNEFIPGFSTISYDTRFYGGERAEIELDGRDYSDLDLFVYDENGNLVASDTDSLDLCYATWTPRRTGNFRVEVVNVGSEGNWYDIETN